MIRRRIAVVGAGGCAREVAWTIRDAIDGGADLEFAGYVVSDRGAPGRYDVTDRLLGDLHVLAGERIDALAMGIGNPVVRARVAREIESSYPSIEWPVIVHPSVRCDWSTASLAPGVVICAGAVLTVNVVLLPHVLVHYNCSVSHESRIGYASVLNPGAAVSGGVVVGDETLVGAGAVILQYLSVGAGAVIGAGAVVTRDVPAGATVAGVPAKSRDRGRN